MKKIFILFLMVLVSGAAFGDGWKSIGSLLTFTNDSNLDGWFSNTIGYCGCQYGSLLDSDEEPCIGANASQCADSKTETVLDDDEYGKIMMIAVKTTVGGAQFCPVLVRGENRDNELAINAHYYSSDSLAGKCFWLCRPGFTGPGCVTQVGGVSYCETGKINKSDYDDVNVSYFNNLIDDATVPLYSHSNSNNCGSSTSYKRTIHVILAVSKWLSGGRGAWLRPYTVEVWGDGTWPTVKSGIHIYPAVKGGITCSAVSIAQNQIGAVLGCMPGYQLNSTGDNCVPINPAICGDYNPDDDDLGGAGGASGCCGGSNRCGADPDDSTRCIECALGKIYNPTAKDIGYCEDTVVADNDALLYGNGNANSTITNQCWTKQTSKDYKKCVLRGATSK